MSVRWTFTDTVPTPNVTYSFEVNPNQDAPVYQKNLQYEALVTPGSKPLLSEGADNPTVFSVQGTILTENQFTQLLYFYELRHQFLCTDDLGRQRYIYLTEFQPIRTPTALYPWKHTYTLSGYVIAETLPAVTPSAPPSAPIVSSISPTIGSTAGGTSVTVSGSHFTGATVVTVGGVPVPFTVISDTAITLTTPSGTDGTFAYVVVTTSAGASGTGTNSKYNFQSAPAVTGIAPTNGTSSGGVTVTITGTGFTGATAVGFGSTPAASFTVVSATQITAVTPAETGVTDVTVTTPVGTSATSSVDQFTFTTKPSVTSVSPTIGSSAGGDTVTITGSLFTGASAVSFGSTPAASFTVVNDTTITAVSPAGTNGTQVDITVTDAYGVSSTVAGDQFYYGSVPIVTTVTPAGYDTGNSPVTITGSNLTGATSVSFGGTAATSFEVIDDNTIVAVTPAHADGSVDVVVSSPGGASGSATPTLYEYLPVGTPGLSLLSSQSNGGSSNFEYSAVFYDVASTSWSNVSVGLLESRTTYWTMVVDAIVPASGSSVSLGSLNYSALYSSTASFTTPSITADLNSVLVVVVNAESVSGDFTTSVTATGLTFTQRADATNYSLYSNATPGTQHTQTWWAPITSAFTGTINLTFSSAIDDGTVHIFCVDGANTASPFDAASPAVVSGAPQGPYDYITTTFSTTHPQAFIFAAAADPDGDAFWSPSSIQVPVMSVTPQAPPTISSISPTTGSVDGGTTVTVNGSDLSLVTNIYFYNPTTGSFQPGTSLNVISDTQLTVITPGGVPSGTVHLVADNGDRSSMTSADQYTYGASTGAGPSVSTVIVHGVTTAGYADVAGGQIMDIMGTGLYGATAVNFGSTPVTFKVISDTLIQAVSPPGTAVGVVVSVTVTTPIGTSGAVTVTYGNKPIVTSISPNHGSAMGGAYITINGSNFDPTINTTFVYFNGVKAQAPSVPGNGLSVSLYTPSGLVGEVCDIVVETPYGLSDVVPGGKFYFTDEPYVYQYEPFRGPNTPGATIAVGGQGLSSVTQVLFTPNSGPDVSVPFVVNSDEGMTITLPSPMLASGHYNVTLVSPSGYDAAGGVYLYSTNPTITGVSPTSGPSTGGTTVTITGTGLGDGTLEFGTTNPVIVSSSDTQIVATSPAGSGTVDIRFFTAIGSETALTSADQFTYLPPPTVTSVSPSTVPSSGGTTVTITGTGFTGASAVKFGFTNATSYTVVSDTQITAVSPPVSPGSNHVYVTGSNGTSAGSAGSAITITASTPVVSSISPTTGTSGDNVAVTGSGFLGLSYVSFGSVQTTNVVINSDTSLNVNVPAGTGTVDITVTSGGGTSATSSADKFTFNGKPGIASTSPTQAPGATSTSVTINGSGFTGATAVTFNGVNAASFSVVSDTQITAMTPTFSDAQLGGVQVVTPSGSSNFYGFTFYGTPTITSVSPNTGTTAGGTNVTITGTNLGGLSSIKFGTASVGAYGLSGDTITVYSSPAHAAGTVDITVTTPGGTSATGTSDQFTYA